MKRTTSSSPSGARRQSLTTQCALPVQLCTISPADPEDAWVNRFNWDHIFSPTLLSHFAYGYLNRNEGYGSVAGQDPLNFRISRTPALIMPLQRPTSAATESRTSWAGGIHQVPVNLTNPRVPRYIANELITWVQGAHTIKVGGEFRHLQEVFRENNNQSGTVGFTRQNTPDYPACRAAIRLPASWSGEVDNGNLKRVQRG